MARVSADASQVTIMYSNLFIINLIINVMYYHLSTYVILQLTAYKLYTVYPYPLGGRGYNNFLIYFIIKSLLLELFMCIRDLPKYLDNDVISTKYQLS